MRLTFFGFGLGRLVGNELVSVVEGPDSESLRKVVERGQKESSVVRPRPLSLSKANKRQKGFQEAGGGPEPFGMAL